MYIEVLFNRGGFFGGGFTVGLGGEFDGEWTPEGIPISLFRYVCEINSNTTLPCCQCHYDYRSQFDTGGVGVRGYWGVLFNEKHSRD